MSIRYRHAEKQADYDKVNEFLLLHFFPDEPLTTGMQPKYATNEEISFTMQQFLNGMCIIAEEDSTGTVAGVLIAGSKYPDEKIHLFKEADKFEHLPKWAYMLRLLAKVEEGANVFDRYNVEKAMHCHVTAVNRKFRGQSISYQLKKQAMEIAKLQGFKVFTCDCSSIYSARVSEKLNMKCINIFRYSDYLYSNGKQIFEPLPPHDAIKTFAIQL